MYYHLTNLTSSSFLSNDKLEFNNDASVGQSGSPVYTNLSGVRAIMAVASSAENGVGTPITGPRLRSSMWNDICSWIAYGPKQSVYGSHPTCN
jgi:V8-like Glu-specific endopeptidase